MGVPEPLGLGEAVCVPLTVAPPVPQALGVPLLVVDMLLPIVAEGVGVVVNEGVAVAVSVAVAEELLVPLLLTEAELVPVAALLPCPAADPLTDSVADPLPLPAPEAAADKEGAAGDTVPCAGEALVEAVEEVDAEKASPVPLAATVPVPAADAVSMALVTSEAVAAPEGDPVAEVSCEALVEAVGAAEAEKAHTDADAAAPVTVPTKDPVAAAVCVMLAAWEAVTVLEGCPLAEGEAEPAAGVSEAPSEALKTGESVTVAQRVAELENEAPRLTLAATVPLAAHVPLTKTELLGNGREALMEALVQAVALPDCAAVELLEPQALGAGEAVLAADGLACALAEAKKVAEPLEEGEKEEGQAPTLVSAMFIFDRVCVQATPPVPAVTPISAVGEAR